MRNLVRRLREECGLTQKELGERAGVSRQAINAVETGKFDPSIRLAHDLARLFSVSIEELFLFDTNLPKITDQNPHQNP